MITRGIAKQAKLALGAMSAVVLLGPRQIGKTTLTRQLGQAKTPPALYYDLEQPEVRSLVTASPNFLRSLPPEQTVILDEIQRVPDIFQILRGLIDERRFVGHTAGSFILTGSASFTLLRQTSESLAGRARYLTMPPLLVPEIGADNTETLWLRGGFPLAYLADTVTDSLRWRRDLLRTYIERDLPAAGLRLPAVVMEQLFGLLAHRHGQILNVMDISKALEISQITVRNYIAALSDMLLLRQLPAYAVNLEKRIVKRPKLYWRDSGLCHAILQLAETPQLLMHPVVGHSWEGFIIEQILGLIENQTHAQAYFYRSSGGAELDLFLISGDTRIAIEIKRSANPAVTRGFHQAAKDVAATHRLVVYNGDRSWKDSHGTHYVAIKDLTEVLWECLNMQA